MTSDEKTFDGLEGVTVLSTKELEADFRCLHIHEKESIPSRLHSFDPLRYA